MASLIRYIIFIMIVLVLVVLRLVVVLPKFARRQPVKRARNERTYLMIVLGSGGHTAEMLQLLRHFDTSSYTHRRYIVSTGDSFSEHKAMEFERMLQEAATKKGVLYGSFDIRHVARARQVHQSLLSTPLTALLCIWDCVNVLYNAPSDLQGEERAFAPFPDVIVTNGPATATIMIFSSLLLRFMGVRGAGTKMRCIYVESWARVRRLSLSGRILRATGACDRFLVQWQSLALRGTEFRGQLIA